MNDKKNPQEITFKEVESTKPKPGEETRVVISGHILELKVFKHGSQGDLQKYRKIDRNRCVDIETGEIIEYTVVFSNNCMRSNSSARYNFNRSKTGLRQLVNTNFEGKRNELHITLTYSKCMMDRDQLSSDFKNFWKRLKYEMGALEYIAVYEQHESGGWHIHILVKKPAVDTIYIENRVVREIWGKGFVNVKGTVGDTNVGMYFCKFLKANNTDAEKALLPENYQRSKKKYSKSRGIQEPERLILTYAEAEKLINNHRVFYDNTKVVICNDIEVNRIHYIQSDDRNGKN